MESTRGKFIVFEGIDGCGKITQLCLLGEHIMNKSKYSHICITREPYKSREIRHILRRTTDPYKEAEQLANLFVRDRKEHVNELILPLMKKGVYIISDRYMLSTIIYQSTQGIQIQRLLNMHKGLPVPDITFIVDLPAKIARERMNKEGRKIEQKFEKSVEFQELLRKAYLKIPKLIDDNKIFIIDGTRSIAEIQQEIRDIYDSIFKD